MFRFDKKKQENTVKTNTEASTKAEETTVNEQVKEAEQLKPSLVKTPIVVADFSDNQKAPVVSFKAKFNAAKYSPETLDQRISSLNREVLLTRFTQRSVLVEKAMEYLGGEMKELTGQNINEVAFEINGIRVPKEGFYMIR